MRHATALLLILVLAAMTGCATSGSTDGGGGADPDIDTEVNGDELEQTAYENIGDVRVTFYVKNTVVEGLGGRNAEQKEQYHVLVNKRHSFYRGVPDHEMLKEEAFLYDTDMYDLLKIFKSLGFFDKGNSVNILGDDPVQRCKSERNTSSIIAVEQIRDGKVNTSYFARHFNEQQADADRSNVFNDCRAVMMQAIAGALPRGGVGYGAGDPEDIGRD